MIDNSLYLWHWYEKKNNMHELVLYFVFFFSYPIIECNESFALETKLEYPFSNEMVL